MKLTKRRFPFAGLVLAAIAGILVEEFLRWSSIWLLGLSLLLGMMVMVRTRWSFSPQRYLLLLFVAACFATLHAWQWQESSARKLEKTLESFSDDLQVEGVVSSEVKLSKSSNASFFLEVHKIRIDSQVLASAAGERLLSVSENTSGRWPWNRVHQALLDGALQGRASGHERVKANCELGTKNYELNIRPAGRILMLVHWEGALPSYGDLVRFRAEARPLPRPRNPGEFDYGAWLARQEVCTELKMDPSSRGEIISSGQGSSIMRWAIASRHWAEETLERGIASDPSVVGIIQGITLGITEQAGTGFIDDFKLTGTMHLFAVSGLHVGMLAVIVWFFLKIFRMPRRMAVLTTVPILFFYVVMTGMRTGSLRAAIMATLVLGGFLFYRRPQMINSLAAAAFCLLAWETNLLFSAGWQFSFTVVLAILLLASPFQQMLRHYYEVDLLLPKKLITPRQHLVSEGMRHLAQLMSVSAAAWVGALLPSIFYFHLISFSALGANVIAVPLAFLILSTALMTLLSGLFSSWVAVIFNNANWLFAKVLLLVIHGCTLLPVSSLSVGLPASVYPVLTLFDFSAAQGAVLQAGGKTWVINTGRMVNTVRTIIPFLEEHGVTRLQGLLLTGKDAAHLGGGALLATAFSPSLIAMPLGEGRSPFYRRLMKQFEGFSQKIKTPHVGDQLTFAPTCWGEVLYPPVIPMDNDGEEVLILKFHLGATTVLIMPSILPDVETWLLQHYSQEQLHASILVIPWGKVRLSAEDPLLAAVAPQVLIIASNPLFNHEPSNPEWRELFQQHGMRLFTQDESGAVIIEALPEGVRVHGFLDRDIYQKKL